MDAWTDNKSLVDKVSEVLKWQQCAPANTLTSDWDAAKMIVDSTRELEQEGTKVNAKWVRGHQDNKTKCSALPMEAQMNCEADLEAFQCQRELGGMRDEVFRLGSDSAQLHVQGRAVNSRCKSTIRHAASSIPLMNKVRTDDLWSERTWSSAKWKAHGRALSEHQKNCKQITKCIHKQMLTAKHVHQHDKLTPPHCPFE